MLVYLFFAGVIAILVAILDFLLEKEED